MIDRESPATEEMFFRYALRMTRRRVRLVDIVSAMLLMLAVVLCGLLAMVVCDRLVAGGLGCQARKVMRWGVLAAVGVLGVFTILLPLLKRLSDLYVARMIERAYPVFRNDLTAAVQLDRNGTVDAGLLEAIHARASHEAAQANVRGCVYLGGLKLAGALLGVVLLAFGMYSLAWPKDVADSLARAMGNDAIAPPTHTKIVAVSPDDDTVVLAGEQVQFTATIHQPTTSARLNILRGQSNKSLDEDAITMKQIGWDKTGRKQNKKYRATWRATALAGDVRFQVACGDGKSLWRRLRVLPIPAIREISLRLQWPRYTRQGVQTVRGGRIDAPVGTTVTLRAEANLPVAHASLELANARKSLIMTTDSNRLDATFCLRGNDRYRIVFQAGDVAQEMRTVWYEIVARPDTPPSISLAEPTDDLEPAANESFRLSGKAADNLGLRNVELVCLQGGSRRIFELSRHAAPGKPRVPFERQFNVSQLGRPGDLLTCYVRGRDFCPRQSAAGQKAGQVGRSRAFTILVGEDDPRISAQQAARRQARQDANLPTNVHRDPADGSRQLSGDSQSMDETLRRELQTDQAVAGRLETLRQQLDPQNNNTQEQPGDQQDCRQGERQPGQQGEEQADQQGKRQPGQQGEMQADRQGEQQPGQQGEMQAGRQGEQQPGQQGGSQPGGQSQQQSQKQFQAAESQKPGHSQGQSGAAGMHSGDVAGGAAAPKGRGKVDAGKVDLPLRAATPAAKLASLGRALHEARRQIRDGEIKPGLLKVMGMTAAQFRSFVKEYSHRYERFDCCDAGPSEIRHDTIEMVGTDTVQKGTAGNAPSTTQQAPTRGSQQDKQLRETRSRKVSPEYRKKLEAYLRTVSEETTTAP